MEFTKAICKPFVVEVLKVTTENIASIATFVGTLGHKEEDGSPYIEVDKKIVPNVPRVYPGFYMTRLGGNTRFYSEKVFKRQFAMWTEEADLLVRVLRGEKDAVQELPQPDLEVASG